MSDDRRHPRFLVMRGGAIGDFILTLPAIAALRQRWPEAFIEVWGYAHIAELARFGNLADKVESLDRAETARLFSLRPGLPEAQRGYLERFDLVISYFYDPGGTVKQNLLQAGVRQVICGSPRVNGRHAVPYLLEPLETLALYCRGDEVPRVAVDAKGVQRGAERLAGNGAPVVCLHPGSGSPSKNWPLRRFLALAANLRERGFECRFLVGEADAEVAAGLSARGCPWPVLQGYTLVDVAELLAAACGYVGNDSGITHLAAATGIPVVSLFGPSDPALWAPRGRQVRVLAAPERSSEAMSAITVDSVVEAFLESVMRQENEDMNHAQ